MSSSATRQPICGRLPDEACSENYGRGGSETCCNGKTHSRYDAHKYAVEPELPDDGICKPGCLEVGREDPCQYCGVDLANTEVGRAEGGGHSCQHDYS
ncbi:MAG: hypothetical protein U9N48_06505 [Euryarchaeota archaeon]|nr:hypothetical protein [Euryarchaeota archaeon]